MNHSYKNPFEIRDEIIAERFQQLERFVGLQQEALNTAFEDRDKLIKQLERVVLRHHNLLIDLVSRDIALSLTSDIQEVREMAKEIMKQKEST